MPRRDRLSGLYGLDEIGPAPLRGGIEVVMTEGRYRLIGAARIAVVATSEPAYRVQDGNVLTASSASARLL